MREEEVCNLCDVLGCQAEARVRTLCHPAPAVCAADGRYDGLRVLGAWPTTNSTQQTNSGYC